MSSYRITVLLLIIAFSAGCNVCRNVKRTLWLEPHQFPTNPDRKESLKTYHEWAEEVWEKEARACGRSSCCDDYALGFIDGFVQFVYAGGTTEPPAVPPRKFWNVECRQPGGHVAAQQWFDGYRHGAQTAQERGYRDRVTLQSSFRSSPWNEDWDASPLDGEGYFPQESVISENGMPPAPGLELLPPGTSTPETPMITPDVPQASPVPSDDFLPAPSGVPKPGIETLPSEQNDNAERSDEVKNKTSSLQTLPKSGSARAGSAITPAQHISEDDSELTIIGRQLDGYFEHAEKKRPARVR